MQTNIVLIRHASIENSSDIVYGSLPFPISEKGFNELGDLGTEFKKKGLKPEVIYTSPLVRTKQTADVLQHTLYPYINIIEDDDLRDIEVGSLEGRPMQELREGKYSIDIPHTGGETAEKFMQRVVSTIERIKKQHKEETVFLVSHGDWIRYALWHFQFPNKEIDQEKLRDGDYVYPGEALIMKFEGLHFSGYEHIRREGFTSKERDQNPLKEAY